MLTSNYVAEATTPSGSPSDNTLPVVFEATEDPTLNNLTRNDVNCDKTGTCYDGKSNNETLSKLHILNRFDNYSCMFLITVSVNCKDTKIAVQVRTNKPFNGRIYALGRSETCNIDVVNSDLFRLDLTMTGQDCNTQSVVCNIELQIILVIYT